MMHNNMDELINEWENKINYLSDQITELQTQIVNYQNTLEEKDTKFKELVYENAQLKAKIQNFQQYSSPTVSSSPPLNTIDLSTPKATSYYATHGEFGMIKRQCPQCGAAGFAIKEVEDKSRLLSYIPRRIYAKKRVCTKCRHEF